MSRSLAIQSRRQGTNLELILTGDIDAQTNTAAIDVGGVERCIIDFGAVRMIDSAGVGVWVRFLQTLPQDTVLHYHRCPTHLLNQFSMVAPLVDSRKTEIHSMFLPYFCTTCDEPFSSHLEARAIDWTADPLGIAAAKCPRCGEAAELDAEPEEFLEVVGRHLPK